MDNNDIQFKEFKFVGYVAFYIALFSDKFGTIVKYESDFRKPITEEFVQKLAKEFIKYYNDKFDMEVTSIRFVSKEAYEAYCEAYNNSEDVEVSWRDDNIYINGEKCN